MGLVLFGSEATATKVGMGKAIDGSLLDEYAVAQVAATGGLNAEHEPPADTFLRKSIARFNATTSPAGRPKAQISVAERLEGGLFPAPADVAAAKPSYRGSILQPPAKGSSKDDPQQAAKPVWRHQGPGTWDLGPGTRDQVAKPAGRHPPNDAEQDQQPIAEQDQPPISEQLTDVTARDPRRSVNIEASPPSDDVKGQQAARRLSVPSPTKRLSVPTVGGKKGVGSTNGRWRCSLLAGAGVGIPTDAISTCRTVRLAPQSERATATGNTKHSPPARLKAPSPTFESTHRT